MPSFIDPNQLGAIVDAGGQIAQQQPEIDYMKQMAELLRGRSGMPGMRDAGALQVAPNPLEVLASTGSDVLGEMASRQQMGLQQQQAQAQQEQNRAVLDALMRQQQMQPGMAQQLPLGTLNF